MLILTILSCLNTCVLASKESEQAPPPPPPTAGELQQHGLFLSGRGGGAVCASGFRLDAEFRVQTSLFLFFPKFWAKC